MKVSKIVFAALLYSYCSSVRADCFDDAIKYAVGICGEIERTSKETNTAIKGNADLEANLILKKILGGSAGVSVSHEEKKLEGPLREELEKDREAARGCRERMATQVTQIKCSKKVIYNTCSKPEFGLLKWGSEANATENSGWMDGGHSQPEWCDKLAAQMIGQRQAGPMHETSVGPSSEDSRKNLVGHVQYNYKCSVTLRWNPVFRSQRDPLCGIERVE